MIDTQLKQWATPKQAVYIDAVNAAGSIQAASRKLKIQHSSISRALSSARKRAAQAGYSPEHDMNHTAPEGFNVKGVSTLYNEDGQVKSQWVKTLAERSPEEMISEVVEAMSETIKRAKPVAAPKRTTEELLNCYVITDYHLGMMAWGEECGEDWDLDIAEDLIINWFTHAIKAAPNSHTGVFAQLGDFLHWDGLEAVTPTSRHILDADSRFQKIVRVAIHVIRRIITMLLKKHEVVHVIMADANHDPAGGVWLRELLHSLYEDDPRVIVDNSADSYYCYEWGDTSLFFHHGHKRKVTNIDDVFVSKYREVFGRTKHSYAHMGHLHHVQSKETNLMIVEQHRTLSAKDAYASRGGWMAGRDAKVITYSKDHGEVGRITVSPNMV